jgi:hypothetical protein
VENPWSAAVLTTTSKLDYLSQHYTSPHTEAYRRRHRYRLNNPAYKATNLHWTVRLSSQLAHNFKGVHIPNIAPPQKYTSIPWAPHSIPTIGSNASDIGDSDDKSTGSLVLDPTIGRLTPVQRNPKARDVNHAQAQRPSNPDCTHRVRTTHKRARVRTQPCCKRESAIEQVFNPPP